MCVCVLSSTQVLHHRRECDRSLVIKSSDFGLLGTGIMVERLKQQGTSHSSRDLLKICVKMGASWSAQTFRQAGEIPSGPEAFLDFCFLKTLNAGRVAGEGGSGVAGG